MQVFYDNAWIVGEVIAFQVGNGTRRLDFILFYDQTTLLQELSLDAKFRAYIIKRVYFELFKKEIMLKKK